MISGLQNSGIAKFNEFNVLELFPIRIRLKILIFVIAYLK